MPNKKEYVVRIALNANNSDDLSTPVVSDKFLECLRYAGIASTTHETSNEGVMFDLYPPRYINDSKMWAEQNAKRINTFGVNAVCAPRQ